MTIDEAMQVGQQHHQAGRLAEAEALYRQVLAASPNHPRALHLMGVLAGQAGRLDLALDLITQSTQLNPNDALAWNNLSVFLKKSGRLDESIVACQRSIALQPGYAAAHSNLAAALIERNDYQAAATAARRAIELSPGNADAFVNLAGALRAMGKFAEAMGALHSAIRVRPDHSEAHTNLGLLLLLTGNFVDGWAESQRAFRLFDSPAGPNQPRTQPRWDGENLAGKTILLHAHQGLGDTLQFIRYVPLVAARGGRVIVQCQPELARILTRRPGADTILSFGDVLPPFDIHCPLSSLPALFATDLKSIPPMTPPLRPDDKTLAVWKNRVGPSTGRLRVGLVWQSAQTHKAFLFRNIQLAELAVLSNVKGIDFFSLQIGPGAEQVRQVSHLPLIDHTREIRDLADTAALIMQLDLVITVDTSVAHLSGAMDRPTWLMLPFLPDWRWLLDRDDSPWYPSMRLFRQTSASDWNSVVNLIRKALLLY